MSRIFLFYYWLFIEIAKVNKKSMRKFSDPDRDPVRHQNLISWSLRHAPPLQKSFMTLSDLTDRQTNRLR